MRCHLLNAHKIIYARFKARQEGPIDKIYGKTGGLKAGQLKHLQNISHRRVSSRDIITRELTRQICAISFEIKRQVALLITRKGEVAYVIVGDNKHIDIPDLGRFRLGAGRLKGLRCIHTHLDGEPLSREDLTDLVFLALDLMVSIEVGEDGIPGFISYAHILPKNHHGEGWRVSRVPDIGRLNIDFQELIQSLENELTRTNKRKSLERKERAVLVGVTAGAIWEAKDSLNELIRNQRNEE